MLENNPPVHFERNISNMIAVSARNNVKALLVTMVLNDNYHKSSGNSKNSFYTSNEYTTAMKQHNDITRRIALSTGTTLFDMAEAFPDDATLFTDGLHMNERGNHKRAQLIGDFVIRHFSEEMQSVASSS